MFYLNYISQTFADTHFGMGNKMNNKIYVLSFANRPIKGDSFEKKTISDTNKGTH